jgi:hypothetical protein
MSRRRTALLAVLLLAAPGEAAVLCRAGTGKLALREACRKAEQAVNPAEIDVSSLTGPAGDTGAPGTRGRHPIAIVDSAGTEVGSMVFIESLGLRALLVVTHPALTETLAFDVNRDGFTPNRGGTFASVYYGALDCAGVPYVRPSSGALRRAQVYGDSLYYQTGDASSRTIQSSERDTGAPCSGGSLATARGTCCSNGTSTQPVAPAVRVPLANLGFVPPFSGVPR